ncbi:MAG: DUF2298 domain-containing protein [Anaerolineae bacterium]
MFWEWVSREAWMLPAWWVLVSLAGVSAFPLAVRLLGGLPDKGYTLARALGMLLVAFVYWLLGSYGFIGNSTSGMILAWVIVLGVALSAYWGMGERLDWRTYWRENRTVIIVAEVLFIALFALMVIYRAYQNDTFFTEKPMEMAFISGIMRSESFPPNDPWMAGYTISYYYFGYVMTAMLTMLSGLHSGYGFSMMVALLFALTGVTVFGVVYNLVRSRALSPSDDTLLTVPRSPVIVTALLGVIFVLIMGNFQMPLVEMPYRAQSAPADYFEWWGMQGFTDMQALNYVQEAGALPISTPLGDPQAWGRGGWWWWHTSRILTDYNLDGTLAVIQPIDEVPAFSFILMDVHPHVLALPFVALALGMAINILLIGREPDRYQIALYGVMIGGLIFLNTWDGPILLVILVASEALRRLMARGATLTVHDWLSLIIFGATLAVIAILAYLPFLIGFRSQAGGLIPNLMTPTAFRHYVLMFGPLLLLTGTWLIHETLYGARHQRMNWRLGVQVAGGIVGVLLMLVVVFITVGVALPESRSFVSQFLQTNGGVDVVLPEVLQRQLSTLLLPFVIVSALTAIVARLFPAERLSSDDRRAITYAPATGFALVLLAGALAVTLVPEFVYLRDNFGTRINTIFKFYYQAWILLGVVSAYAVYVMLFEPQRDRRLSPIPRTLYGAMLVFVLIACVPYLFFGMYSRAVIEQQRHVLPVEQQARLTLDGRADNLSADYFSAVQCLGELVRGDDVVIAEASQNTYNSEYGRVGAFYGLPTLINWENHQRQWRGATYGAVAGTRRPDIDRLYSDLRWEVVRPVIDQYSIDYILYGPTERSQYGEAGEEKFAENLSAVCEFGQARVYVVRG